MHVDRRAKRGPIPAEACVVEQKIDAAVAAGAPDRLLRPPPGEVKRVPEVGEVLREEHVVEPEEVLRANRSRSHRLVRYAINDRVEPCWRIPTGHSGSDLDRA